MLNSLNKTRSHKLDNDVSGLEVQTLSYTSCSSENEWLTILSEDFVYVNLHQILVKKVYKLRGLGP